MKGGCSSALGYSSPFDGNDPETRPFLTAQCQAARRVDTSRRSVAALRGCALAVFAALPVLPDLAPSVVFSTFPPLAALPVFPRGSPALRRLARYPCKSARVSRRRSKSPPSVLSK